MNTEPLVQIESALVALEVELRTLSRAVEPEAELLARHSRYVFKNTAGTLHGIRSALSNYLYRNAPIADEPAERD